MSTQARVRRAGWLMAIALVCTVGLVSGTAYGTTYYVATTGNDTNSGTSAGSPFRTIQKGVDTANGGDTIEVAAGTYREKVVFNSEDGGTPGAPVTLHGASGAIIDASNAASDNLTWTLQGGFNGGVYTANLGYNTNCVFVNDRAYLEVDWATCSGGFSWSNMWWWERFFSYGMKNVAGYPDFELWGAIPVGWDAVRSLAMLRTTDNTLWVKCMPDGEGSTPLNISQQTVRVSNYDANVIRINGANDIIIDGFRLKYGYDSVMVVGGSMGVEIKNCVIKPCFNGIWLDDGASGVSIHNCEIATDKMEDKSTKDRADNIWHMNKSQLLLTNNQDKWAIFTRDNPMGGYRIYDNYAHDIGVGISGGPCAEINNNKVKDTYQDAIGGYPRNLNVHHNVLDNVLQFGRIGHVTEGPTYIHHNIMISGPITQNGLVFYMETAGYAPEAYFYNNTLTQSPDVGYLTAPGCVVQDFFLLNNCSCGGENFANHHIYNNLFWGDRWLKVNLDSNNTPVEPKWDGDYNVYVLRGDTWQYSGGVWSIIDNPSATWLPNNTTDPPGGQEYAQGLGIDLNALWTTAAPGFTNFANKDLSLTSGSPARGRGANLTSLFGTLPGSPSTDCGALAYGQSMLSVPGTSGGALSTPVIAGVTPTEGGSTGGALVHMTGVSLTGASVSFGGSAATSVAINPAGTHLTCLTPAHSAGTVNVTVTTAQGTSNAVTFTYNGGGTQTTLSPTADTLLAAGAPTTNYGTDNNMQIQNNGPNYSAESIVKFNLTSLGGAVTSAKLRVYKNGSSSSLTVTASSCSDDSWTEGGVNWNNRPTKGTSQAAVTASAGGWYEWDITSYANSEYAGDKTMTVYLSDLLEYRNVWTQWWTKEYSDANLRPRLIVTTGSGGSAPTLSSISPGSGTTAGGTACTLTGTDLTGCTGVSFGGTAATGIIVDSATQVRCTSPAKTAGTVSVTATTGNGTSNGVNYVYITPAPTLSSIAPGSGAAAGGTACTLTGTNLTGCTGVSFGGTAATGIVVDSATQVRCTSPAKSAGTYSVTATTPGGTSNGVNYIYAATPVPTLSSISPTSGTTAGGTACTLTGTNLTGCSGVTFDGTAATGIVVDSATQVRCTSPAHASGGAYSVIATTPGGSSNAVTYTYVVPAPTLSGISPGSGSTAGGTACTLTGTNLTGCSAVSFGGTAATGIVVDSATQVRCTSPAKSAGTYSVTATTPGGTSNGVNYIYTAGGGGTTLLTDGFETNFDKWTDGGTTDWTRVTAQKKTGSYSATAGPSSNDLISDNLNASTYGSMTISFWYRDDDIDAAEGYLQFFNGTSYVNKVDLNLATEDTWTFYTVTINNSGSDAQYFVSNFRIKFECTELDSGENLWIDDVNVIASGSAPAPTLSSISPASGSTGGGTACTLTGTNLTTTSSVSFGGTAATGIVVDSATQVRCTSPAKSAGTYGVTATTGGGTSNAVSYTYTGGGGGTTTTLSPAADTMVTDGAPTTNWGAYNNMQIQNNGPNLSSESLVKFDLTSLSGTITSAKLRVYKNGSSSSLVVTASSCSDDSWTEGGVNWNNRPTKGTSQATATAAAAGWYEWDITSYASSEFAGNKIVTVYLSDLTEYRNVWTQWWTKEYSDTNLRPRLVVITQ